MPATEVERHLPGAQIMPPIQRGDLFRDRAIGFRVFLILDGVFFQNLAVSPREIIDVIRTGGVVFGASSMGALRAADCAPAGMRGLGSIYRLFRRGALTSDDEVAVALSPIPPYQAVTVPLINVRLAVSRLVRAGALARCDGVRLTESAAALYFADRTWPAILAEAGLADHDRRLAGVLGLHDLKAKDGLHALERVQRWWSRHPRWPPGPKGTRARITPPTGPREAAQVGIRAGRLPVDHRALWDWLIGSGRYRVYDGSGAVPGAGPEAQASAIRRLADARGAAGRELWRRIAAAGERDAVRLRFTAVAEAAAWAQARGLEPTPRHRAQAEREVARAHGFRRWTQLDAGLGRVRGVGPRLRRTVALVALAKRAREAWFAGRLPGGRRLFPGRRR